MSTRAQIAIQIEPNQWAQIYVHYDGYPSHMLPALAPWTPEDILAAKEIRQVRADGIEAFERPRDPEIFPRPTCQFCHLGLLKNFRGADSMMAPGVDRRLADVAAAWSRAA